MLCKKLVPSISIYLQGESQQYDQNYYIKEERTCDDASCLCWHTNVTHVTHQFSEFQYFQFSVRFPKLMMLVKQLLLPVRLSHFL